ncbi:hypothetical protein ALC56_12845 [Trachymyrmex septentrionalis]|uniref:Uncharacterized protein n=1 Tax=Trachymyrmex septentrionalis TaxID=34720 RepID=A0A195EYB0_9HYME|nr:hypothetical protein ALC56_12845 [Trachymyrmex septentrionalis]
MSEGLKCGAENSGIELENRDRGINVSPVPNELALRSTHAGHPRSADDSKHFATHLNAPVPSCSKRLIPSHFLQLQVDYLKIYGISIPLHFYYLQ